MSFKRLRRNGKTYRWLAGLLVAAMLFSAGTAYAAEPESANDGSSTYAAADETGDTGDTGDSGDTAGYNGFHKAPDSSDWYYYKNGKVDTSVTDVKWGTVDSISGWWNVVKGKVTRAETVAQNSHGWWYINANGMVDFTYTGFAKNKNGSWYCEKGKVTFQKNSVIQDTKKKLGRSADWYYVVGSKVRADFTGLANYSNKNGWWYIKKGKVDFTHNGVDQNKHGWWYVTGGKVRFNYTGLANYSNKNGWWYIKKGKVDFTHNGVDQNKHGWWYVTGGKVRFNYTGLANYRNKHGWWYIKNGKVDFSVNTIAKNKNGWWYVKSGKVDFSAGSYSFAANTSQIIDVRTSGSKGTLTMYNKSGSRFAKVMSVSCYVGRNGITSNKVEGDKKTPSGVYTLGQAFGVASNPGSTRSYLKVNSNYYWVDDSKSKYYNQLVDVSKTGVAWSSAEHLSDYTQAYKYAIAINYNTKCTPYKGSAIFLHCSTGSSTAGCVAVSESNMITILRSLKSDTRIYIHSK